MKNLKAFFVITISLVLIFSFQEALANGNTGGSSKPLQGTSVCDDYCYYGIEPPKGTVCICNPLKANTLEDIINNIIDFVFDISIIVAPLMVVWAGWIYMTSGGDEKKLKVAKNIILYTIAGIAVILFSKGFYAIVKQLLGI